MDIREFLTARLAEDEAWARAASSPYEYAADGAAPPPGGAHWTWAVGEHWTPVTVDPALDEFVGGTSNLGCSVTLRTVEEWPDTHGHPMPAYAATDIVEIKATWAGHMVRHDPARVLRDVEVDRQLVAWALSRQTDRDFEYANDHRPADRIPELRILASRWREHPDYDPTWSPESVTGNS